MPPLRARATTRADCVLRASLALVRRARGSASRLPASRRAAPPTPPAQPSSASSSPSSSSSSRSIRSSADAMSLTLNSRATVSSRSINGSAITQRMPRKRVSPQSAVEVPPGPDMASGITRERSRKRRSYPRRVRGRRLLLVTASVACVAARAARCRTAWAR
jgi:hypothetical protein